MKLPSKSLLAIAALLLAGCANNPYAPAQPAAAGGGVGNAVSTAIINAIIQSMAASVLNGQIGSQLVPADQNFRLQQLGGALQAGAFTQAQQWLNPQTGNTIALKPISQLLTDAKTGQSCRTLEEVVTLKEGNKTLKETRRACQNPNGQWVLTQ